MAAMSSSGGNHHIQTVNGVRNFAKRGDALPVPDLTGIAERDGGTFPWLKIVHMVDGRTGLRGHGGPMPIFGAVFTGDAVAADGPQGTPVITSQRVLDVVDYLMSIQR